MIGKWIVLMLIQSLLTENASKMNVDINEQDTGDSETDSEDEMNAAKGPTQSKQGPTIHPTAFHQTFVKSYAKLATLVPKMCGKHGALCVKHGALCTHILAQ